MILIIGKEATFYNVLMGEFAKNQIKAIFANSYKSAVEFTKTNTLAAIISEYRLDDFTGIQVLGRLRSYGIKSPFFLITSANAEIPLKEAFKQGVEAVFNKDISQAIMSKVVLEATAQKNGGEIRRKFPRINSELEIEFESSQMQGKQSCTVKSVGLGGLFLHSGANLPNVGDFVAFSIKASPYNRFAVEGEAVVRWVRLNSTDSGFGVEFYCLTDEGYQQISELYNSLCNLGPETLQVDHRA